MQIDYISDTHLDFYVNRRLEISIQSQEIKSFCEKLLPDTIGEILIVPGDLGHCNMQNKIMLEYFAAIYKNVYWVFGNHDLYLLEPEDYNGNSSNRIHELVELTSNIPNISHLNNNIKNYKGINILGTPIFYDGSYGKRFGISEDFQIDKLWKETIRDHEYILKNNSRISFKELKEEYFKKQYGYLLKQSSEADILVTHIAPTDYHISRGNWADSPSSSFFCFDGTQIIENCQNKKWLFGHAHSPQNFFINDCEFFCNPIGYPRENKIKRVNSFKL